MSIFDNVKKRLKKRPTFLLRKPLVEEFNPSVHGIDSGIDARVETKKAEWRSRGYTENQVNMATSLATEWAYSMSRAFAPPELREATFRHNLEKGFEVAEKWLKGLLGSIEK